MIVVNDWLKLLLEAVDACPELNKEDRDKIDQIVLNNLKKSTLPDINHSIGLSIAMIVEIIKEKRIHSIEQVPALHSCFYHFRMIPKGFPIAQLMESSVYSTAMLPCSNVSNGKDISR
jgi:hypothetical protein